MADSIWKAYYLYSFSSVICLLVEEYAGGSEYIFHKYFHSDNKLVEFESLSDFTSTELPNSDMKVLWYIVFLISACKLNKIIVYDLSIEVSALVKSHKTLYSSYLLGIRGSVITDIIRLV